ncbi:MAG: alginate lyase family protein [Gemmatimonadales bacterium]
MTNPWRLLRTIRHHRPDQLFRRAFLLTRRHLTQRLEGGSRLPRWWHEPCPPVRSAIPDVLRREDPPGNAKLPHDVDLAGRPFTLETSTDWAALSENRGTPLQRLHLHYFDFLPGFSPADAETLVLDWIQENPPFERDYWKDGWNSYATSIRIVAWIRWLMDAAPRNADSLEAIHTSLARQIRFLARNRELDIGGNHLVRNIRALLWGAAYFGGPEARGWRRLASRHLAKELEAQILPDGLHFERSPAYHFQVFQDLLESCVLLEDGALKSELELRLDDMAQVAVDMLHPDGLPSLFRDGGLHVATPPEETLGLYREVRGETPAPRTVWRLPEGGFAGARGSTGLVIVSCGRIGADTLPAHAHGDVFSFEWSVDGRRLIVDMGVAEYHAGPLRDMSRATRSHNTVTLDGRDQAEFWSSFRVGRRPDVTVESWQEEPDGFRLVATHTGYRTMKGRPVHERSFRVSPHRIRVRDRICGGAGQQAEAGLLVHPTVDVALTECGATLKYPTGVARLSASAPTRLEEAVWMPDFGVTVPTHRIVFSYGAAPCEGSFELELERRA